MSQLPGSSNCNQLTTDESVYHHGTQHQDDSVTHERESRKQGILEIGHERRVYLMVSRNYPIYGNI